MKIIVQFAKKTKSSLKEDILKSMCILIFSLYQEVVIVEDVGK